MPFPPPAEPLPAPGPEPTEPVVRPYTVTRGRTRPERGRFDLASVVAATPAGARPVTSRGPEQVAILKCCREPISVAELAARLSLPAAVIRVLLGDLLAAGLITVSELYTANHRHTFDTLEAIRDGLRAL